MSHLEALKERLKRKPEVRPNEGVRVVLAPAGEQETKMEIAEAKKNSYYC